MKSFLGWITSLSVRFRYIVLAVSLIVSVLGGVSATRLQQELLPPIDFPQTIILAQVSGMSSDQVLLVLTRRIEGELSQIPEIVNVESTTTGTFGAVITASNNFGLDQDALRGDIQNALNNVWLPLRRIESPDPARDVQEFALELLGVMTPDVLIYLAERDVNFLFQLSPEVWTALPDATVATLLSYLAGQVAEDEAGSKTLLEQRVEQEIFPVLAEIDSVANVQVSGGQAVGDEAVSVSVPTEGGQSSLLLNLSSDVWTIVAAKAGYSGDLDQAAVDHFAAIPVTIPATAPALPETWQMDHFSNASDLREMITLTRTQAGVFNDFYETGRIIGGLGQTDDLTPDVITQMLAIDPTLVYYFEAEHLVAMSPEVFNTLAEAAPDFIAGLDGFTRDALAAAALAQDITGQEGLHAPVTLPAAWRIQPPQIITFSFADIPLASFSVFSTAEAAAAVPGDSTAVPAGETPAEAPAEQTEQPAQPGTGESVELPEGPALPLLYTVIGELFGAELNTADDLVSITLSPEFSELAGVERLRAADFFNFLTQFNDLAAAAPAGDDASASPLGAINPAQFAPALAQCGVNVFQIDPENFDLAGIMVGCLEPEVIAYLVENDPTFMPALQLPVFEYFSDDMLLLDGVTPPLAEVWSTLSEQPQFGQQLLATAADLLALGDGRASSVLNTINAQIPERFAGYEIRLFNSLTPATVRYFALREPGFYSNLDSEVLLAFAPETLAQIPADVVDGFDAAVAQQVRAIASGEQPSAATNLASRYVRDVEPEDPNAPALNAEWQVIAPFVPAADQLENASDLIRFFPAEGGTSAFFNSFFDSAQGANFAPNLFGNMSVEVMNYVVARRPNLPNELRVEVLRVLPPEILATFPEDVQARAASDGPQRDAPTRLVTRANSSPSLVVTVYKNDDANTVEAFYAVWDALRAIDAADPTIEIGIIFEQSSFVEESISGVVRDGVLGAIFAVLVILVFLSEGFWERSPRRITGLVLTAGMAIALVLLLLLAAGANGGDLGVAWNNTDVVLRVLLIAGVVIGTLILVYPGNLPFPAWRSTLVSFLSIPLSILIALALIGWLPGAVHALLLPFAEGSPFVGFLLRLFPENLTLNIMTLSGLTVAIGRVVDDAMVVLENIYRQIQSGGDKREAIIVGTRDVSVAILVATLVVVVVFLPLGLTGGLISEFFLPFGLAATYALLASFIVAITAVPALAYLFIAPREAGEEEDAGPVTERALKLYMPLLRWSLNHKWIVVAIAVLSVGISGALFVNRPFAFLPSFGDPQITVSVNLPQGTLIEATNTLVVQMETQILATIPEDERTTVQVSIGGGGLNLQSLFGGNSISENVANITIGLESQELLDRYTPVLRREAEAIFGQSNVTVSGASIAESGFGGFELVVSGPREVLVDLNATILETLGTIPGLTNIESNLPDEAAASDDTAPTFIQVNGSFAIRYSAELETQDTIGVTQEAKQAVQNIPGLPDSVTVSEGFQSQIQQEGFLSVIVAMPIAGLFVIVILMVSFRSLVHWLTIFFSIIVAPIGAAIALTLTDKSLGISALIGLLMLIGLVVSNAVVLIDRVQSNRHERGMAMKDALLAAGERRLRPIVMITFTTFSALIPLAIGLSEGALIASELGIVVIGGVLGSMVLTLVVVPVVYMLLDPVHQAVSRLFRRGAAVDVATKPTSAD